MPTTILKYFHNNFAAQWVQEDGVQTATCDGRVMKWSPFDGTDAIRLGYLTKGVEPDVYWFTVEKILLHSWLANRLHGSPSLWIWVCTRFVSDEARDKIEKPLHHEIAQVEGVMRAMNDAPDSVEHCKVLGIDYTIVLDARAKFRFPVMNSQWRDELLKDPSRREPKQYPKGWPELSGVTT